MNYTERDEDKYFLQSSTTGAVCKHYHFPLTTLDLIVFLIGNEN